MKFNYYVYVYLDPLKPKKYSFGKFHFDYEPFYIGMGKKKRIDNHIKKYRMNEHKTAKEYKILKILDSGQEPIRYKLYENITEHSAKRLEKYLIKLIGRRDLGLGTLTNLTDGGDGTVNVMYTDEQRENIRLRNIKMWKDGVFDNRDLRGEKNGFFNKTHTEETLNKIKETIGDSRKGELNANFGKKWSEEQIKKASIRQKENHKHLCGNNNSSCRKEVRDKISKSKTGLQNPNGCLWELVSPKMEKFRIEGGIKRALLEYGLTYERMKYGKDGEKYYSKDGWQMYKIFV